VQLPAAHAEPVTLVPTHACQQAPQLVVLVLRFASQPFACLLPSQSAKPALHVPSHTPAVQVRLAMLLLEHDVPQPPQLFGSVPVFDSQPSLASPLQSL
jgi:hypothetical protein